MIDTIRQLIDLSELDRSIQELNEQLERYPKMLGELDKAEKTARRGLKEVQDRHRQAQETRRKQELEVKGLRDRVAKYERQQSQVKTNKEMEALDEEIGSLNARIEEAELAGLEALEIEEQAEREIASRTESLATLEAEQAAERERIERQRAEKQKILESRQAESAQRRERLPEDARDLYEMVNQKYPGSAVVPIEGNTCGGCKLSLVPSLVANVRRSNEIVQCDHCSRILYLPGAASAAAEPSPDS